MKNILIIPILVLFVVLSAYVAALAFTEPAAVPPNGNVPIPINVGSETQSKAGDLEVNNLTARGGISLGGVFRDTWPEGNVAGCDWEGTKCSCKSDSASIGDVRILMGMTCIGGTVVGMRILGLDISSRSKDCWGTAPATCTAGYTRN